MIAIWFILIVAGAVGPIAFWQYGNNGAIVVGLATATVIASTLLAAWLATRFARNNRAAMGLLAGTGIRMFLPLALVLAIVTLGRGRFDRQSALNVVPLYFAMLIGDTIAYVRRVRLLGDAPISVLKQPHKRIGN